MNNNQEPSPALMYDQYFVPGMFARWAPVLLEHAAPQPGERVLDLACGTGIMARSVAPLVGAEGTVIGLDISPDMLTVAREKAAPEGAAIEWLEGDAAALDLPDDAVDLVLCQQGLQFFPDRAAAVREIRRVLAPGGRAVISVWKSLEHQPVYLALCEAEARHLGISVEEVARPAFTLGDKNELRTLFEEGGFQRVDLVPASNRVRFPEPERFVMLTTLASAAVIPEFQDMDEAERSALVETVGAELEPTLQAYVEDNEVAFHMHAHIARAHA